jgi:hypothetical protein
MRCVIGYGVFAKRDMFRWYMEGIRENFQPETIVRFYHEACDTDDGYAEYLKLKDDVLAGWDVNSGGAPEHILEHGVHRYLIERFLETDCDVLIVPQDDNRFQRPLLPDLQKLWDIYGTSLGWISGRDGHGLGYADMVCSPFSDSNSTKTKLPIGEYREVLMMNTGPVVYFRHVIEKVGLPDPDMPWYWWSDYSLRCKQAGLTNILLSMSCLHEKFGRIGNNPDLFKPELVADCLRRFNERWSKVYGRNPL